MADVRAELSNVWPLFGLTIRTPRLELKLPTDRDIVSLAKAAREGVHSPDWLPMGRWTIAPSPKFERGIFQFHCGKRASWKPDSWALPMAVYLDGEPIGCQEIMAGDFGLCRTALTGSWLAQKFHRNGYGTEMRQAIVWFAFEVLGAMSLWSDYWLDNQPSAGVSCNLGYQIVYIATHKRDMPEEGEYHASASAQVRLRPGHWNRPEYPILVSGFEPCREMFGL